MRITTVVVTLTLGCTHAGDDSAFEAGAVDATPDVDRSVCTLSIADYCDAHSCPANEDAGVSELCASNGVVAVCGGVVVAIMIDFGSGYVFDNGALTTVFSFNNGTTTCIAGTVGSNASATCPFTTNACLADAGDASLE